MSAADAVGLFRRNRAEARAVVKRRWAAHHDRDGRNRHRAARENRACAARRWPVFLAAGIAVEASMRDSLGSHLSTH
uniref:Uncharacterized protein n=1 Tax=Ralstonia solanacearum TaxID=305 RepID=A0A0S4TVQ7_RALSL|nr:protein of unknown function [Ralstonia solanacearum]